MYYLQAFVLVEQSGGISNFFEQDLRQLYLILLNF